MVKVKCSVNDCKYNKYLSCLKDDIEVILNEVRTKCNSYKEKIDLNYSNEFSYMDFPLLLELNVKCHATDCYYNKNNKCISRKIEIKHHIDNNNLSSICKTHRKKD